MKQTILAVVMAVSAGLALPGKDSLDHDVGVEAFLMPDTVDTGAVVTPTPIVANYGQWPESLPVWFTLPGGYLVMETVSDLGVGMRETLSFPLWRAPARGWNGFSSWTLLAGDENPANDTLVDSLFVRVKDVGITDVDAPDTTSPDTFRIRVELTNFGNVPLVFPLLLRLGLIGDTVEVESLMPGESRWVSSDTLRLRPGVWLVDINAALAGDHHRGNNDTSFVFYVRGTIEDDVACVAVLRPIGIADTLPFAPQARVANYGTQSARCTTCFWIEDTVTDRVVYSDREWLLIPSGMSFDYLFRLCTLSVEGPYVASCSLHLDTDQNWTNNAKHNNFRVGGNAEHDVMVSAILAPEGAVDSGAVVTPRAVVYNAGQWPETFPVYFDLPGWYLEMLTVTDLPPGEYDTLLFPRWSADVWRGDYEAVAWTLLSGDENRTNDTLREPFTVQVRDIWVRILAPRDTVADTIPIYPVCEVGNEGTTTETFELLFQIGTYEARESVFGLPPETVDTVTFSEPWEPSAPGIWLARAQAVLVPPDPRPGRNVVYDTIWVLGSIRHDVGVEEILSPVGRNDTVGLLDVEARVRNHGRSAETFRTYFSIFDELDSCVYRDTTMTDSLAAGDTVELQFRQADINQHGCYTARCSTFLADDQNWTNNLVISDFTLQFPGVQEDPRLPLAFGLGTTQPSHFRSTVAATFSLLCEAVVDLAVFDASGRRVRTLIAGTIGAGCQTVVWDGRTEDGSRVGRGIYYVRMTADEFTGVKKLVKVE